MPVEPYIPLSFKPTDFGVPKTTFNAEDRIQLQNLVNQGQLQRQKLLEEKRQMEVLRRTQEVQSQPDFYDPKTGMITLKGIRALDEIQFGLGQHALRDQQSAYERDLQSRAAKSVVYKQVTDVVDDINKRATEAGAALEAKGVRNPNILDRAYSEAWQKELDQAKASGRFAGLLPDEIDPMIDNLKKNIKPYYEARAHALGPKETLAEPGKKEKLEADIDYKKRMADLSAERVDIARQQADLRMDQARAAKEALDKETLAFRADQYIAGDTSVRQGYARNPQALAEFDKTVAQRAREQGITPQEMAQRHAEFEGRKTEQRTLGGRGANLKVVGAELEEFVPLALDASKKVPRSGFKAINQLMRIGRNQWSEEQAAFEAANRSVINAFAQLASRGVSTVHNTEEAEKMLNTAQTPEQYEAVLKQLQREAKSAIEAVGKVRKQTRDEATGKPGEQPKTIKWNDLK